MSDGANTSAKLSDRFPDASVLTDLVGQLKDGMAAVKTPELPGDKVQNLSASLNLNIPDTSTWHTAIPDEAWQADQQLPGRVNSGEADHRPDGKGQRHLLV